MASEAQRLVREAVARAVQEAPAPCGREGGEITVGRVRLTSLTTATLDGLDVECPGGAAVRLRTVALSAAPGIAPPDAWPITARVSDAVVTVAPRAFALRQGLALKVPSMTFARADGRWNLADGDGVVGEVVFGGRSAEFTATREADAAGAIAVRLTPPLLLPLAPTQVRDGRPGGELELEIASARLGPAIRTVSLDEVRLTGLPDGVEVVVGGVTASPGTGDRPGTLSLRGVVLDLDLDRLRRGGAQTLGSSDPVAALGGDPSRPFGAATGRWAVTARDATVRVRWGDSVAEHRADVTLAPDGTLGVATRPAALGPEATAGARLRIVPGAPGRRDGVRLAFDAWLRGGRFVDPRVAPMPLSGLSGRALGLLAWQPEEDSVDLDLREIKVRGARATGFAYVRGLGRLSTATYGASLRVPEQDCQALLDSVPEGTWAAMTRPTAEGRFSGGIDLAVDMRDVAGTLTLEGKGDPRSCRLTSTGPGGPELAALAADEFVHGWPVSGGDPVEVGPGARGYVPLDEVPRHVLRSMIVTEDGRFWGHRGLNLGLIRRALAINLKKGRYVYGGSTITQQLMKNLFLSRRKTLARKLEEAVLALAVERLVPKKRLLELYVNVIEFGPNVYGIERASQFYFDKPASSLTPIEGAFLAAIKPKPSAGPSLARRGHFPGWWHKRLIDVMRWLEEGGYITPLERARAFPYYPEFRGPVLAGRAPHAPLAPSPATGLRSPPDVRSWLAVGPVR